MSYDCVEALNATQRRDICPFINVQMWKTFNKLFTFILVYLWTEAVSAVSSPVFPAKPLPSAGAQGVMGRRKVRLFSLPIQSTQSPYVLYALANFDGLVADIGRKSVSKNIS